MSEDVNVQYLDEKSYAAKYDRQFFRDILTEGIIKTDDFEVTEKGTPDMSVDIAKGRAFVQGDQSEWQGHYGIRNDATVNKAIAASDPTNPRKDRVIAQVYDSVDIGGAEDKYVLEVLTGTPAPSPSAPALPDDALDLALIDVGNGVTEITNANITNQRSQIEFQNVGGAEVTIYADKLNLAVIVNAANPTYQIDVDADGLNLYNASEEVKHANAVNVTIDVSASGANGLDTGSEASSTWYSIWVIGKADGTVAGLLHAGGTGVIGDLTFPSGYTYARRIGWVRNDGSSNFIKGYWYNGGEEFWWDITLTAYTSSADDKPTSYTDLDLSAYLPPTSNRAILTVGTPSVSFKIFMRKNGSSIESTSDEEEVSSAARGDMVVMDTDDSQIVEWMVATSEVNKLSWKVRGYKDSF